MRQPREGGAPPREAQERVALRRVEVERTYLALDDPAQLIPSTTADANARVERRAPCPVATYRRLYKEVGERWHWHERAAWTDDRLATHLARPDVQVWELMVDQESAGYFELQQTDGSVEIVYFGLIEKFIGRGLGGFMLARAAERGWAMGATRVWLHTCTLDSKQALPAYLARGFRPFKREKYFVDFEGERVIEQHPPHATQPL